MKKPIAVVTLFIFLFAAFWMGEAGKTPLQIWPYMIGLAGAAVLSCLICRKWTHRTFYGFLFFILYAAAFYMGDLSFKHAYDSCLHDAEQIRTALADYKIKNGRYPRFLDDLSGTLPCSRWLRGTILEYESTSLHYRLWFKDWLVEQSATDREPFLAHK